MTSSGYREEVFNVLLALLLHERGVVTAPEQSFRQALQERRHVPDVLVVYRGLRTVIEGKVDDKSGAGDKALAQARDRVSSGVAHIGIALLYPAAIRKTPSFPELQDVLISCTFKVAVCSETGETGWTEGGIDYLADVLRGTFDQLIREDAVTKAVWGGMSIVDTKAFMLLITHCSISGRMPPATNSPVRPATAAGYRRFQCTP